MLELEWKDSQDAVPNFADLIEKKLDIETEDWSWQLNFIRTWIDMRHILNNLAEKARFLLQIIAKN